MGAWNDPFYDYPNLGWLITAERLNKIIAQIESGILVGDLADVSIVSPVNGNLITCTGTGGLQNSGTLLSALAPLNNPTFTGVVVAPLFNVPGTGYGYGNQFTGGTPAGTGSIFADDNGDLTIKTTNDWIILDSKNGIDLRVDTANFLRLDSNGNFGIKNVGVEAWSNIGTAFESPYGMIYFGVSTNDFLHLLENAYYDGAWKRKNANTAAKLSLTAGAIDLSVAATGAADSAIAWVDAIGISATTGAVTLKTETSLADGKNVKVYKALGSSHTTSGLTIALTAHENLVFGDVCFINSDGEAAKADSDSSANMPAVFMSTGTISANAAGTFLIEGTARDDSYTWTPGAAVYASGTPGELTPTAPTGTGKVVQILGRALSANIILFKPDNSYLELT